jgi:hypothetical protein
MECTNWTEEDWKTLLFTIQQKNCILMLGPDAATEEVNGQPRPLTDLLAQELAGNLPAEITQHLDLSNLAQVAEYYLLDASTTRRKRNDLEAKVCGFYDARGNQTNVLFHNLAALPFYLALTSTADHMLAQAFQEQDKSPEIDLYNFRRNSPKMVKMGTVKEPLVFYLYGATDEPQSLVLTENNLLDFLVAVTTKNPPLPNNILSELRDPNKSLLFLGFGFKHWYLRILLHVLQGETKKESRSFALEQRAPKNIDEFRQTILFFRNRDPQITICAQELRGFVKELRERYERLPVSKSSTQPSAVELPNAPTVFLCHAKPNRDIAEYLRDRLREAGFNAWFDEDDLRGGDEWDRVIQQAIAKKIDYFIVLQSQVMVEKIESYFHKEIRLALERQEYFKSRIRFIIPVKIEACPLLEDLEHLQTIDLSKKENVNDLISAIKRDQERRKKG